MCLVAVAPILSLVRLRGVFLVIVFGGGRVIERAQGLLPVIERIVPSLDYIDTLAAIRSDFPWIGQISGKIKGGWAMVEMVSKTGHS